MPARPGASVQALDGPARGLACLGHLRGNCRSGLRFPPGHETGDERDRCVVGLAAEQFDVVMAVERLQEREADRIEITDRHTVPAEDAQDVPDRPGLQCASTPLARIVIRARSEFVHGCNALCPPDRWRCG